MARRRGGWEMRVYYPDVAFLLNGALDYLVLCSTLRLMGLPLCHRRIALAAALGGALWGRGDSAGLGISGAAAGQGACGPGDGGDRLRPGAHFPALLCALPYRLLHPLRRGDGHGGGVLPHGSDLADFPAVRRLLRLCPGGGVPPGGGGGGGRAAGAGGTVPPGPEDLRDPLSRHGGTPFGTARRARWSAWWSGRPWRPF